MSCCSGQLTRAFWGEEQGAWQKTTRVRYPVRLRMSVGVFQVGHSVPWRPGSQARFISLQSLCTPPHRASKPTYQAITEEKLRRFQVPDHPPHPTPDAEERGDNDISLTTMALTSQVTFESRCPLAESGTKLQVRSHYGDAGFGIQYCSRQQRKQRSERHSTAGLR